jgi:CheY-like chemotaxis protein
MIDNGSNDKYRILIIDSNSDIALTFRILLEQTGLFSVVVFNDPLGALNKFKSGSYDLILLNDYMPQLNAFKFYQKIKQIDSEIKVCFVTAFETSYIWPKINLDCIIKIPLQSEEFLDKVKSKLVKAT